MSSAGPNNPSTVTQFDSTGGLGAPNVWTNTNNIFAIDGSTALCQNLGTNNVDSFSQFLQPAGYGFSVNSSATMNGIQVAITRSASASGRLVDFGLFLLDSSGNQVGTDHRDNVTTYGTSLATVTYGSSSDMWGTSFTVTTINNANFGASWSVATNSASLTNANCDGIQITVFFTLPAPTVTSCSPNNGPASGGTSVTVTGTNFFATPSSITFGGTAATSIVFVNSTTLTCTTPSHAAATVNVVVTNPDGQTGTGTSVFTFNPAPTVTSCSPNNGPATSTTSVTITGSNFVATPTSVTFGGTAATGISFTNSTTITCTAPTHSAGAVNVVVTNPDGQTGTGTNVFTYNAPPSVTSCSPSSGTTAGGTSVTITGSSFVATPTSVTFGGTAATGVSFTNSTTITCTTPAHVAGTVNVVITNPDGQTGTGSNVFTFNAIPSSRGFFIFF